MCLNRILTSTTPDCMFVLGFRLCQTVLTVTGVDILQVEVGLWWPEHLVVNSLLGLYIVHLSIHKSSFLQSSLLEDGTLNILK